MSKDQKIFGFSVKEITKDVFLIVIGALISFSATQGTQYFAERRMAVRNAQLLRLSVQEEVDQCQKGKGILGDAVKKKLKISPESFDVLFEPAFLPQPQSQIEILQSEVIEAVIKFDFSLRYARFIRGQEHEALVRSGGEVASSSDSAVTALQDSIDRVVFDGNALIKTIDKYGNYIPDTHDPAGKVVIPFPALNV